MRDAMRPITSALVLAIFALPLGVATAAPEFLEDRFELPAGFRIYRAAGPELCGGSYALAFDGEGRLLVGDGNAVRRLADRDEDGLYDHFEVLATGLGWRGPQGLLVWDDRLYAVGGDGVQLFEGYRSGRLVHRGRIGNPLKTGGDHEAHTLLRGWDDHVYLITGDGGGAKDRSHITEESSPALFAREASVFRISPDGQRWECMSTGGRNPPNLGLNYLGELFSLDSDMEWHVGLPWWRPVRLNHWLWGGDQGWQEMGAHPPYFIDSLPGIFDVGRGSPNWGLFYEHRQLPEKYRDAFLVCDYRWKRESADQYHTTGRLLAFVLKRKGAGWEATMETLAHPRPGARDATGHPIHFALVDIAVAPDGSVFLSDHNQGVWRIVKGDAEQSLALPPSDPLARAQPTGQEALLEEALQLPQPSAEYSRLRADAIRLALGARFQAGLQAASLNAHRPARERLNALRLLASELDRQRLPESFLSSVAKDANAELRAQSAWLLGLRGRLDSHGTLLKLVNDADPWVRRRAIESLTRISSSEAVPLLISRLSDPERVVRYAAMVALAHRPTGEWLADASVEPSPQARMGALIAARLRRESPPHELVRETVAGLLKEKSASVEARLDLLRLLALFRETIEEDPALRSHVAEFLVTGFPAEDRAVRFEQARLLGVYRCTNAFSKLLSALTAERDSVVQFHFAQALARLPSGWTEAEEQQLVQWLHGTQQGWFAEFSGKGVEFPHFWSTVLEQMAARHGTALLRDLQPMDFGSSLGAAVIDLLAKSPEGAGRLIGIYQSTQSESVKRRALLALGRTRNDRASQFLQTEYHQIRPNSTAGAARAGTILRIWAEQPDATTMPFVVYEGLFHEDPEVVRASANGIGKTPAEARRVLAEGRGVAGREPQIDLATDLLSEMIGRPQLFRAYDQVFAVWSGLKRAEPAPDRGRVDEQRRAEGIQFWKDWFRQQFKQEFKLAAESSAAKSDEAIHQFLLSDASRGGDVERGARAYEKAQCHTCHGGGVTPGREGSFFGPDLMGAARRLSRPDLADALVYPSKQVADRFKAIEVELKSGDVRTGFVTEDVGESITLAEQEQVRRISRDQIKVRRPQNSSLMPSGLLNPLSWEEIRDLLAFLDQGVTNKQQIR